MLPALTVDVVSDVVCPWCYIGKRRLEAALARLRESEPDLPIQVRWHPFQLNPDLPAEGRYVGDREELVRLAQVAGYDPADARAFLDSDEMKDAIADADRRARTMGISGVPFFIFGGKTAVSGAHEPEALLEAIAQARAAA